MKNIYCVGSSFTQGGGFEFESTQWFDEHKNIKRGDKIKELYKFSEELPKTQYNYSYPGQLQKLYKNIKVHNLGKSGYGNEYIVRKVFDIVNENNFNKTTSYFILEFTEIGRKEYYYQEVSDYVISNYMFKKYNSDEKQPFPIDDVDYEIDTHGCALEYYKDTSEIQKKIDYFLPTLKKFNSSTLSFQSEVEYNHRMINLLLSYLELNDINYLILSKMQLRPSKFDFKKDFYDSKIIKWKDGFKNFEYHEYMTKNKLTIKDETNGEYIDSHYGIEASKLTAQKIKEYLDKSIKINRFI